MVNDLSQKGSTFSKMSRSIGKAFQYLGREWVFVISTLVYIVGMRENIIGPYFLQNGPKQIPGILNRFGL